MNLENRIQQSRERSLAWLDTMDGNRFSGFHDPVRWPGMCLPACYDAVHCRTLLGGFPSGEARKTIDFLNGFQMDDGTYRLLGMASDSVYKGPDRVRTREYIDFHATNYAFGAVRALGGKELKPFRFMDAYRTAPGLLDWTERRIWNDPWMEGNLVVNLGSFLLAMAEDGDPESGKRVLELMEWLDRIQDPATGFWGERFETRREILEGMAGAMHTYHLYYYLDRPLPRLEQIARASISLAENELAPVTSACLDVDIVELLANIHRLGLYRAEIEAILEKKLSLLLDFQNPDGGFCDESNGILRFDGWPGGYWEPQGISNCFATWFRCATVGIISCILFPGTAGQWKFRSTIGIGYFKNIRKDEN